MRRVFTIVTLVLLASWPAAAGAGGGGFVEYCDGSSEGATLAMLDSCFQGTAHFTAAGSLLTVSNDGAFPHTMTAVDGSFDSGFVDPGSSFELTIGEPGIYRIFCTLHGSSAGAGMAGVLIVGEPSAADLEIDADVAGDIARRAADEALGGMAETQQAAFDETFAQLRSDFAVLRGQLTKADRDLLDEIETTLAGSSEWSDDAVALPVAFDGASAASPPVVPVVIEAAGGGTPWLAAGVGAALALAAAALALATVLGTRRPRSEQR